MSLNDLTIKQKLMGVTGFLLVASCLMTALVFYSLNDINAQFYNLKDKHARAEVLTLEISRDLNLVSRLTRDILLGADYDKAVQRLDKTSSHIRKNFDELEKIVDEKDKPTTKDAKDKTLKFIDTATSIMKDMSGKERTADALHEAYKKYKTEATPPAEASRESFEKVSKLAEEGADKAVKAVDGSINMGKKSMFIFGSLVVIFGFIPLVMISRDIVSRLCKLQDMIEDISTTKDLTRQIGCGRRDEIGLIAKDFNQLVNIMSSTIRDIKLEASETASVAAQLSQTSHQIGKRAEEETTIVMNTSESGNRIKSALEGSIVTANKTRDDIKKANEDLENSRHEIVKMTESVKESAELDTEMAGKLEHLANEAEQVRQVLGVINDIADQTNLLALNAAIEAARAGEHGRGFAVVADEVRKLAERTQKSLVEINSTISSIVESINNVSGEMSHKVQAIEGMIESSHNVEHKINQSVDIMRQATNAVQDLVASSLTNSKDTEMIIKQINDVKDISVSNTKSVEEIAVAAENLHRMTQDVDDKLNRFRT